MKYMNQMLNRVFIPQQRKLMGSSVVQAPGQVQRRSGEGSEGSEKGLGGFGAEPGQVQQGSGEGSGESLGGFGAEPGHVQQDLRPFNSWKPS